MQLKILKHIISRGILKILDSLGLPYFCGQGVPQHGSNVRKRFVYSFEIKVIPCFAFRISYCA